MTSEVVVMNKSAVALAADSAVTTTHPTGRKIYYSVNKLYTLSKYHPVGVMVYGNAQFMGIPWETIIKAYRRRLGAREMATLREYADDFLAFLQEDDNDLFPESIQDSFFNIVVYSYFLNVKQDIDAEIESVIETEGEIDREQVDVVIADVVSEHHNHWETIEQLDHIDKDRIRACIDKNRSVIERSREDIFGQHELADTTITQLEELVEFLFTRKQPMPIYSGVVIAGFGKRDIFPCLYSYLVEILVNGQLKYSVDTERCHEITLESDVAIFSFAQTEVVGTFIDGVDPNYMSIIYNYLSNLLDSYASEVLGAVSHIDDRERSSLVEQLKAGNEEIVRDFFNNLIDYQRMNHSHPILFNVGNLPKDELAKMAESLVNITSFKRRVSLDEETVGGPIDVAVISKGDGFIWIKRKHYFEADENPHFFTNYFKDSNDKSTNRK